GVWTTDGGVLRGREISDRRSRTKLVVPEQVFALTLADGTRLDSTQMRIVGTPATETIGPSPQASRLAERLTARRLTVLLEAPNQRVQVTWRAELRDGSRYLRQEVTLRAVGAPLAVREIVLLDLRARGAALSGNVKGSPITIGSWFVGFEHPLSQSTVEGEQVRCALARELPLRPESPFTVSSVIGATRPGQMRRHVLGCVQRQPTHP